MKKIDKINQSNDDSTFCLHPKLANTLEEM